MIPYILLFIILKSNCLHLHNNFSFITNLYHNNSGLHSFMQNLTNTYPGISQVPCQQDDRIRYLHIGNDKPVKAIIICNIHARQIITSEVCIEWAQQYLQKHSNDTGFADFGIAVFYLANINRDHTVLLNECIRQSPKGIDMNRNFPTEFAWYKTTPASEIYPGMAPFADTFTQCLSRILQQKPVLFVDFHSGENGGMFYQEGFNSRQDRQIMQLINKNICNNNCRITTLARDGEAINGHIFADVKVRLNMRYSLLFEIYGDAKSRDCISQFNPNTKETKDRVVAESGRALDLIIKEVRTRENL